MKDAVDLEEVSRARVAEALFDSDHLVTLVLHKLHELDERELPLVQGLERHLGLYRIDLCERALRATKDAPPN